MNNYYEVDGMIQEIDIEHSMDVLADMISYNDPEYASKLIQLTERAVDGMYNLGYDMQWIIEEHDRLLELGVIDN